MPYLLVCRFRVRFCAVWIALKTQPFFSHSPPSVLLTRPIKTRSITATKNPHSHLYSFPCLDYSRVSVSDNGERELEINLMFLPPCVTRFFLFCVFSVSAPYYNVLVWRSSSNVANEQHVDQSNIQIYLFFKFQKIHSRDIPWLWNPGQTSPEVQNRGISGPTKRTIQEKKHNSTPKLQYAEWMLLQMEDNTVPTQPLLSSTW